MNQLILQAWREDDGVLSFEWVLLISLLTIGLVSGLAGARDAITDELGDIAEAAICWDQSYEIAPSALPGGFIGSSYVDTKPLYVDCDRTEGLPDD